MPLTIPAKVFARQGPRAGRNAVRHAQAPGSRTAGIPGPVPGRPAGGGLDIVAWWDDKGKNSLKNSYLRAGIVKFTRPLAPRSYDEARISS